MADELDGVQAVVPDRTDWSGWTFALALRAVTGDVLDLRQLSRAQWFVFDPASIDRRGGNEDSPSSELGGSAARVLQDAFVSPFGSEHRSGEGRSGG